jgi:hypothetical protein
VLAVPAKRVAKRRGVSKQRRSQILHPDRHRARVAVFKAIKSGRIVRPDHCSRCLEPCTPQAHHRSYELRYEVEFLCRGCHRDEHYGPKRNEERA